MEEMPPEQESEHLRAENEYLKNRIAFVEKKQILRNAKKREYFFN
jgi:hypothetical protein